MPDVTDGNHYSAASAIRDTLATYREAEDLINIGAYVPGSNPRVDHALSKIEAVRHFLKQGIYETSSYENTVAQLMGVA
jgi:flagellum-specific ATP synthase